MVSRSALSRFTLNLAGIDPAKEAEENFFGPIGQDQLALFLLKCPPAGLEELDPEDANILFLDELNADLGLDFQLDPELPYAWMVTKQGSKRLQVVLDLSGSRLVQAHFLGDLKEVNKLAAQLSAGTNLLPTRLGAGLMQHCQDWFEPLSEVYLHFEQSSKLFHQPQSLKAHFKGPKAPDLLQELLSTQPELTEITQLSGPIGGEETSLVSVDCRGQLRSQGLKLERFLELAARLSQGLNARYQTFEEEHLTGLIEAGDWSSLAGLPLEYSFAHPLDKPQVLVRQLCNLSKPLGFLGHATRLTTREWRLDLADPAGGTLSVEVSLNGLRAYPRDRRSLGLVDRLEAFLASQISAGSSFFEPEEP